MTEIIVTRADEMLAAIANGAVTAVLSIEHPNANEGKGRAPRIDTLPQKILCFWDAETPVKDGPDIDQVREGLQFIMDHLASGTILIHCNAGIARSTAMALGAFALLYPDESEAQLIDRLIAIRPIAAPNILVLEIVDHLTNRDGKLVQAVKDHPLLSEARAKANAARERWKLKNPEDYRKMHPEKFPKP